MNKMTPSLLGHSVPRPKLVIEVPVVKDQVNLLNRHTDTTRHSEQIRRFTELPNCELKLWL